MPDLNQILQALGGQPISGNPASGQAQYPNGWSGFAAGITDWKNQQINQQRAQVEGTRQNLLGMIGQIPDSEQNTPLKFKMMMDIMNAGDKHWSDKVLAPSQMDNLISGMYKVFSARMPEDQPNTGIATTPSGQQVAARPRIAAVDGMPGSGLANATAGDPNTGQVLSNVQAAPQPGKLNFSVTNDGKWQGVNEVFQDEKTGDKYLMQYNKNSGESRKINLGQAKTEGELTAAIRAQAKTTAKNAAVSKGYYDMAVALSGIGSPDAFNQLPLEIQNEYYAQAGKMKVAEAGLKEENTKSNIIKNKAIAGSAAATVPYKKAQTENLKAQPKDSNAITADEKRTVEELTKDLDKEIALRDKKLLKSEELTPKMKKQLEAERAELVRQRDAIRNKVLDPMSRINNANPSRTTKPSGGKGTTIPKGASGPVGANNDPLGIRK